MSEENRSVLDWIAQLMKPNTRETALLELSKKREEKMAGVEPTVITARLASPTTRLRSAPMKIMI
jgi:hypothetical protein